MKRISKAGLVALLILMSASVFAACNGSLSMGIGGGLLAVLFFLTLFLGGTQSGCDVDRIVVDQDAGYVGPCLSPPRPDDASADTYIGPCLGNIPPDAQIGPCLEPPLPDAYVGPCLSRPALDAYIGPCLGAPQDPDVGVGPCLDPPPPPDLGVCLSPPPPEDAGVGPCLFVDPDAQALIIQPKPAPEVPHQLDERDSAIEKLALNGALPEDLAKRLRGDVG